MRREVLAAGAALAILICAPRAEAALIPFAFSGAGISGSGTFTVGHDAVAGDPANALAITGMSGTFSDSNVGIVNAKITGIVPISPFAPKDPLAPTSFSKFAVTNPVPPGDAVSYDNLIYLDGSPIVCTDYPGSGGFLDVYGVLFTLDNGDTVDLWSNGRGPHLPPLNYGAIVIDPTNTIIDSQSGLAASVPEPAAISVLGIGLLGLGLLGRRRTTRG